MTVALTSRDVGVTRQSLSDALAGGPAAWESLEASAATPSPFMSWAWHRAWADAVPAADLAASQVFALSGPDGALQAVLPVMLRRVAFHRVPVTALTWASGDVGCPDHLDVLAASGTSVEAFAPSLDELPWQLLILSNLAPGADATPRLCDAMAARGYVVRRQTLWTCPYLELPEDWDRYLGTLSATRRQTVRRKERQLQREHTMTITDYDQDRVEEGLRYLFSLHERRWQGGAAFEDPSIRLLHRRFAEELAARRRLWLSTLDIAGKPVAAWYGFAWGDTVYFYQSGRDPRWERQSVGLVLMGTMIRRAIERGYRRFDFLRGDDPYKRQWTTTERSTEEITIFRRGLRAGALRALDAVGELRARLRRKTEETR